MATTSPACHHYHFQILLHKIHKRPWSSRSYLLWRPCILYITLLMTLVYDFLQQFNVDAKNGVKIEEQTPTILLSFANFFWPNFSLKNSHSHLKIVFRASRKNWTEFKSDYKLAFTPLWTAVLPLIYMEKSGWKWTVLCICL